MTQRAPAQRLTDFVDGRASASLPQGSIFPRADSLIAELWAAITSSQKGWATGSRISEKKMRGIPDWPKRWWQLWSRVPHRMVRITRDPINLNAI
ncbi:MAG: hypothetical protein U5L72_09470 [Bacteroidales bacterium]|nr:hypothetical protein [Bacteroidales bacterium]